MRLSSPEARASAKELILAFWLLLFAVAVGAALRFPQLDARPMHTDEATQSLKLRDLLQGRYEYDPHEHHGPTALYSAAVVNAVMGRKSFPEMTETSLRLSPVLFGMALLLLLPLVGDGMGRAAAAWSALFLSVSPLFVFFARYFIMETLLVFFTFSALACGWRFVVSRKMGWLIGCAASFGLMHATKETFVLHAAAMAAALGCVLLGKSLWGTRTVSRNRRERIGKSHLLVFVGVAAFVSVLCFTQGFTHLRGAADSLGTYFSYLDRAGGQGHEKPFLYYFKLLLWNEGGKFWLPDPEAKSFFGRVWLGQAEGGFVWTEAMILVLAVCGAYRAFTGKERGWSRGFVIFLTLYAGAVFLAYSLIAYKTPWCIMTAHHALILLAGFGAAGLLSLFETAWGQAVACLILFAGAGHLALQSWRANFKDDRSLTPWLHTRNVHSSPANPYAYGYTPASLRDGVVAKLEGYAGRSPDGQALNVQIASPGDGWPLPWYLRKFTRVGYWRDLKPLPDDRHLDTSADVILVDPKLATDLPVSVRGDDGNGSADYAMDIFGMLNQQFWIRGYVRRSLLPESQRTAASPSVAPPQPEKPPQPVTETPALPKPETPVHPPTPPPPAPIPTPTPTPVPPVAPTPGAKDMPILPSVIPTIPAETEPKPAPPPAPPGVPATPVPDKKHPAAPKSP